jgi:gliding motility-associated-like protein
MMFIKRGFTAIIWTVVLTLGASLSQAQIQISFSGVQPTCNGYTDGTVTASPSGGTEPYGYFWNNGQGGKVNTGVPAGTYFVTVTDGLGITATGSYTLAQPAPLQAFIAPVNFACGGLTGQLYMGGNGTAPYTYLWQGSETTSTIEVSAAGNYFATLTDAKGCADAADFTLAPTGSTTVTLVTNYNLGKPKCFGGTDGSAAVAGVWGLNPPFTYVWQNGTANQALNNVPSGNYKITFTDAQGCTALDTVTVPTHPELTADIWKQDINCWKNQGTGSLQALSTGGFLPYSYAWSNGSTAAFQQNTVPVGTYTLTVLDANGCSKTDTETIISAPPIEVVFTAILPSCGGSTGSATIQASGGTPPYKYIWGPDNYMGQTRSGLAPGTYYVCTQDAANCTKDTSVVIPNGGSLQVDLLVNKPECIGVNDGTVTAVITPNNSTYTYQWSLFPGVSVPQINGVPGNTTVSVTVTDLVSGCQGTATAFVGTHTQIDVMVTDTDLGCNGLQTASATATAANGLAPYTYAWFIPPSQQIGVGPTINGLGLGAYSVVATDANGCTGLGLADIQQGTDNLTPQFTYSVVNCDSGIIKVQLVDQTLVGSPNSWTWTVTAPAPFGTQVFNGQMPPVIQLPQNTPFSVQLALSNAAGCAGSFQDAFTTPTDPDLNLNVQGNSVSDCANGPITLTVSGAAGNVYTWSPMTNLTFNPNAQNVVVNPSATTAYTVSAFNGGCTDSKTIEVVRLTNPVNLSLDDTEIVTCDSSINVTANINAGIPVVWTDAAGVVVGAGAVLNVNVMGQQVFFATATNGDGCTDTDTLQVTGNAVDVNVTFDGGDNVICEGESLTLTVNNQDPTDVLTYVWSVSTGATITPNGATATVSSLVAATYTVTVVVKNQFGCSRTLTKTVEVLDGVNIEPQIKIDLCDGLNVGYSNTSGVSGTWNFGDNTTSTLNDGTHTYATAGNYTVTFTPNVTLNCSAVVSKQITVFAEPLSVTAAADVTDCKATATIQFNGTANHPNVQTWAWTFVPGGTSGQQNPVLNFPTEGAGVATLTVTDANGCTATTTVNFDVNIIVESVAEIANICPMDEASLNPDFDPTYTYVWTAVPPDPNLDVNSPNPTVSPDVPTVYSVAITNGNCVLDYKVTVTPLPGPDLTVTDDVNPCSTDPVTLTASGTATSYSWYNDPALTDKFGTTPVVTVVPAEDKMVYVVASTAANCTAMDSVLVDLSIVNVGVDPLSDKLLCEGSTGQIAVNNNNVDDNLTYVWSPELDPVANPTVTAPAQDVTYSATVTNQHGCTAVLSFAIDIKSISVEASITGPDTICTGQTTDLLAVPSGDGSTITFAWTPANTLEKEDTATPIAQPTETTDYTVTVTNEFECTATDVVTVHFMTSECEYPYIFIPNFFTPNNDENNDKFIVRGVNISELYFVVWDRWGEKVYETEDVKAIGWDGTYKGQELTPDSYAWYVRIRCGNGAIFTKKGDVTLMK